MACFFKLFCSKNAHVASSYMASRRSCWSSYGWLRHPCCNFIENGWLWVSKIFNTNVPHSFGIFYTTYIYAEYNCNNLYIFSCVNAGWYEKINCLFLSSTYGLRNSWNFYINKTRYRRKSIPNDQSRFNICSTIFMCWCSLW